MGKMNTNWLHMSNQLLSGVLLLFGFASCGKESSCEYGTPYARHTIKGKVLDKETKTTIPDIQLIIKSNLRYLGGDTVVSDVQGEFVFRNEQAWPEQIYRISGGDKIGEVNSKYKTGSITVEIDHADLKGETKNWYKGEASKEVVLELEENK